MAESELPSQGIVWHLCQYLLKEHGGELMFLLFASASFLGIVCWSLLRSGSRQLQTASILIHLSLPCLASAYFAWRGFERHWHSSWGHPMKLEELAECGSFFCIFLWLGLVMSLPAYFMALAVYVRRSFLQREPGP